MHDESMAESKENVTLPTSATAQSQKEHASVLLNEAVTELDIKNDGVYVDATFGRGGHSQAILDCGVKALYAFDRDPTAQAHARERFAEQENFVLIARPFSELQTGLAECEVEKIDGLLMDLGVSSPQFDVAERGFSFRFDGPLDMRMDFESGEPVSAWLAKAEHSDIARVLRVYGDEKNALAIATAILAEREHTPLTRTSQLADIVRRVKDKKVKRIKKGSMKRKEIHPATQTFQALRIFINKEMQELENCLQQSLEVLKFYA